MRSSIFVGRPIVVGGQLQVPLVFQHWPRVYLRFGFVRSGETEGDEVSAQLDLEARAQK